MATKKNECWEVHFLGYQLRDANRRCPDDLAGVFFESSREAEERLRQEQRKNPARALFINAVGEYIKC